MVQGNHWRLPVPICPGDIGPSLCWIVCPSPFPALHIIVHILSQVNPLLLLDWPSPGPPAADPGPLHLFDRPITLHLPAWLGTGLLPASSSPPHLLDRPGTIHVPTHPGLGLLAHLGLLHLSDWPGLHCPLRRLHLLAWFGMLHLLARPVEVHLGTLTLWFFLGLLLVPHILSATGLLLGDAAIDCSHSPLVIDSSSFLHDYSFKDGDGCVKSSNWSLAQGQEKSE